VKIRIFLGHEGVFPDKGTFGKGLFDITHVDIDGDVDVARVAFVNHRSIGCDGRAAIEHPGQFLIFDVDKVERFQGSFFVYRSHCRNFVTNVPDLVHTEELLVSRVPEHSPFFARCVLAGDDGVHPAEALRTRRVYIEDLRVGVRAPKHLSHEHTRQLKVRGEDRLAGDSDSRIDPGDALADVGVAFLAQSRVPPPGFA